MLPADEQVTVRTVGKSPLAFRTISEVASELDLPQHVLRFWESKFTQVTPTKRGGGRRYYRPEDIQILRQIRSLLYEDGYTIKGAQKLLKNGNQIFKKQSTASPSREPKPSLASDLTILEQMRGVLSDLEDIKKIL